MDLCIYVEKVVAPKVLSSFMEELQSESVKLYTRKQLDVILLIATDTRHRIDRLCRQLKHLLQRIGAILPLAAIFVLSNTPPRSMIQGLYCYIINMPLTMVI